MRKVGKYWTDKNNNVWDQAYYTKKKAIKASKTLKECYNCMNCTNCIDCNACSYCSGCVNCNHCYSCNDCKSCLSSLNCEHCDNCILCDDCYSCRYCRRCESCNNCNMCFSCTRLEKFNTNPQVYTTPRIGRRYCSTTLYWYKDKTWLVTGCFTGTLDEFKLQVLATHGNSSVNARAYKKEIKIMERLVKGTKV
jgi:hypothetical protein